MSTRATSKFYDSFHTLPFTRAILRIKLFLEQFGVRTCVLNSELPATIRCHSVNQFNQGVYDNIIASDEKSLDDPGVANVKRPKGERKSKRKKDKESGVSRGIDFQFVSNVINFDFPLDVHAYIHRAGRTARGNNQVPPQYCFILNIFIRYIIFSF